MIKILKSCAKRYYIRVNECLLIKGGDELFSTYQNSRTIIFNNFLKRLHHWLKVISGIFF